MSARNDHRRDVPLPPAEDYVVAESSGQDDAGLILAPPDGKTAEEATEELTGLPGYFEPGHDVGPDPPPSPLRFTLFELFAALTFLCIEAGIATWFPLEVSAGVLGLCTCGYVLAITFGDFTSRLAKLGLATLVLSYAVVTIATLVRS